MLDLEAKPSHARMCMQLCVFCVSSRQGHGTFGTPSALTTRGQIEWLMQWHMVRHNRHKVTVNQATSQYWMWAARHVPVSYLIIHSKAQVMSFFEMAPTTDCLTALLCIICDCSRSRHLPACHTPFENDATAGAIHLTCQHAATALGLVQHLL